MTRVARFVADKVHRRGLVELGRGGAKLSGATKGRARVPVLHGCGEPSGGDGGHEPGVAQALFERCA